MIKNKILCPKIKKIWYTLNNDSHFIIIFFSCILFISFYLNTTYIINQLINQLLIN